MKKILSNLSNLPITIKLTGILLIASLLPMIATIVIATSSADRLLQKEIQAELAAMAELKANAVQRYFEMAGNQVVTLAQNGMIVDSMVTISQAYSNQMASDRVETEELAEMDRSLMAYYRDQFGTRFQQLNDGKAANIEQLFTSLPEQTRALQYTYISNNPSPLGEKDGMERGKGRALYHRLHEKIHPTLRNYLQKFGYYDIFLADIDTGNIVYSVFKELDFATSLIDGPYADTGIGEAFRRAKLLPRGEFALTDYALYRPSYDAPASFAGSPIYDGDRVVGVLIFQMPLEPLNAIMSDRAGLGTGGQSYLLGADRLMRSDPFIDAENYSVTAAFKHADKRTINTPVADQVLGGSSGNLIAENYVGEEVIATYRPISFAGINWGVIVEKPVDEALAPVSSMVWKMLLTVLIGICILVPAAIFFGRLLSKPIKELTTVIEAVAKHGDFSLRTNNRCADETGRTSQAFDTLMTKLSAVFGQANDVLQALTRSDYSKTISGEFSGEVRHLVDGINSTVTQLEQSEKEKAESQQRQLEDSKRRENEAMQREKEALEASVRNGRIKQALDSVSGNVMIADDKFNIIYTNESLTTMLRSAERDLQKELPQFSVDGLIGGSIDRFHKNPQRQQQVLAELKQAHQLDIRISEHVFRLTANPIFGENGNRIGTVMEWLDRTAEVAIEREIDSIVSAGSQGDFSNVLRLEGKQGFFLTLSENLNHLLTTMDAWFNEFQEMFSGMVVGDLSSRISGNYSGAFEELKLNANQTADKLSEVLTEISDAADTIATSAAELASATSDLSTRTEQQASSLQQTAASMEHMTKVVADSTQNASSANRDAIQAQEAAHSGGEVVGEAIVAMTAINQVSNQISDIIGVIDEIAFQTNMLALNAAVEAARAGEQGRGFAVVASEVRSLAQRSAEAAREIKDLIQDSVEKVDVGSNRVNASGETLKSIVSAINSVTSSMDEIARSAVDQNQGISEVNSAISHMDEMTQQNAAMVEQSSAASASMAEQARGLKNAVAFFKTAKSSSKLQSISGGRR